MCQQVIAERLYNVEGLVPARRDSSTNTDQGFVKGQIPEKKPYLCVPRQKSDKSEIVESGGSLEIFVSPCF